MDLDRLAGDRTTAVFGVSTSGAVATLPARPAPAHPPAALDPESLVPWDPNGEFAWMGTGVLPNAQETERAIEVISAVPLAAAVGWSVRGHQWTTHPRRLRTAVVSPSKTWDIEVMRGVREVDGLSGRILVRMRHIRRLDVDLLGELNDSEPASEETTIRVTRAMRESGFRLLYLGAP